MSFNTSYRENMLFRCFDISGDNPIYENGTFIIKKQLLKTAISLNGLNT